jgi:hypothetical protein
MNLYILNLVFFVVISLVGCTEIIDLELRSSSVRLVVDAVLTNEHDVHVVKLSKSSPYFSKEEAPAVSNAKVIISNDGTDFVLTESVKHAGYYYIEPELFMPRPGKTYTLSVSNVDIDDVSQVYTAKTTMPQPVQLDSTNLLFNKRWESWQILSWFQDPPNKANFYLFKIIKNDLYLTYRPSDLRVTNDYFFDGNYVNGVWVQTIGASAQATQLVKGDSITLQLCSIEEEFYKFMSAFHAETSVSTPLFSGPPANLPGNISNGALGMFSSMAVTSASIIFNPEIHF